MKPQESLVSWIMSRQVSEVYDYVIYLPRAEFRKQLPALCRLNSEQRLSHNYVNKNSENGEGLVHFLPCEKCHR